MRQAPAHPPATARRGALRCVKLGCAAVWYVLRAVRSAKIANDFPPAAGSLEYHIMHRATITEANLSHAGAFVRLVGVGILTHRNQTPPQPLPMSFEGFVFTRNANATVALEISLARCKPDALRQDCAGRARQPRSSEPGAARFKIRVMQLSL